MSKFLDSLPTGSIGIDLGCGNGKNMTSKHKFIIGNDRCEQLLKHAVSDGKTIFGDAICACMLSSILRAKSMVIIFLNF